MNQTITLKEKKEISKQVTHFINTYCRDSNVSFHDAYSKLLELYEQDRVEFNKIIDNQECPRKVS